MKHAILLIVFLLAGVAGAQIPLPSSPSWSSQENDYSTGGAFADVTGDGRVDLCTSNGNDMAMNYNGVYVNRGDSLERTASWRSADNGYFGHCYSGDVDNDGDMDLAVAYLGPSGDLRVRVYRNSGAGLEAAPYWKARDQHSSFDCCLGDVDLDGDLDLAISAGDAYSGEIDSARIYRNNGGTFDSLPFWTARDGTASDAIRFCDIDNDGDLDLFVGHRRKLTMHRNNSGVLDPGPAWVVTRNVGWVLRLEPGD
ncbi:VCBS repeat-containing protein, partial [candidate division WOR-3 bacterium]|nr:VCBS repeat-containing protein [candidate division WOR-3 bacterium]